MSNIINDLSELSLLIDQQDQDSLTSNKLQNNQKLGLSENSNTNNINSSNYVAQNLDLDQTSHQIIATLEEANYTEYFFQLLDKYTYHITHRNKVNLTLNTHQGLDLFASLHGNIEKLEQYFTFEVDDEVSLNLTKYRHLDAGDLFSKFIFKFRVDKVYFLDLLNDEQMSFIQYIIKNRVNPTNKQELGFLMFFSTLYFYTLAHKLFPRFQENFLTAIKDYLNSPNIEENKEFKQYLVECEAHISTFKIEPFVFSWAIHNNIGGLFHFNTENKTNFLLLNHLGIRHNAWTYIIDIITHELGHWIDNQFSHLKELPKNWKKIKQFHSSQWVRLTQLAFNRTPVTYNSYQQNILPSMKENKKYFVYNKFEIIDDKLLIPNKIKSGMPTIFDVAYSKSGLEKGNYFILKGYDQFANILLGNLIICTHSFVLNGINDVIDNRTDKSELLNFYISSKNSYDMS